MAATRAPIRRSESGDAQAFLAEAHAAYDANLRRFFTRRGVPRHDVDDMVQEVYLRLARQPGDLSVRSAEAFVITIAGNLLRDAYRRRGRRNPELSLEEEGRYTPAAGEDPERSAEYLQHLQAADSVIGALRPATQRVFLGHRLRGQSYSELSRELGVSISMIEKHMISALSALRPVMADCSS